MMIICGLCLTEKKKIRKSVSDVLQTFWFALAAVLPSFFRIPLRISVSSLSDWQHATFNKLHFHFTLGQHNTIQHVEYP